MNRESNVIIFQQDATYSVYYISVGRPASWSSGQSLWLLIMRSRVRFPARPWEFSLEGRIPAVTMVWVVLRALLALHPPIWPLTSPGQRNCASWASQPQKSVTPIPCPGGRTTKSIRACGGIGQKKNSVGSSTCFGCWHPSSGARTAVITASGID